MLLLVFMHLSGGLSFRDLAEWVGIHCTTARRSFPPGHTSYSNCLEVNIHGSHVKLSELTFHQSLQLSLTHKWFWTAQKYIARLHPLTSCNLRSFPHINLVHSRPWSAWPGVTHCAVTIVSGLYAGSVSDREIFKLCGITNVLTPDMTIMVHNGFLVDKLAPCKVYHLAFLSKNTQMCRKDVKPSVDCIHCLSEGSCGEAHQEGEGEQTFWQSHMVCYLCNYQNRPLVKAWATRWWMTLDSWIGDISLFAYSVLVNSF